MGIAPFPGRSPVDIAPGFVDRSSITTLLTAWFCHAKWIAQSSHSISTFPPNGVGQSHECNLPASRHSSRCYTQYSRFLLLNSSRRGRSRTQIDTAKHDVTMSCAKRTFFCLHLVWDRRPRAASLWHSPSGRATTPLFQLLLPVKFSRELFQRDLPPVPNAVTAFMHNPVYRHEIRLIVRTADGRSTD
jgi:hypothetical protein